MSGRPNPSSRGSSPDPLDIMDTNTSRQVSPITQPLLSLQHPTVEQDEHVVSTPGHAQEQPIEHVSAVSSNVDPAGTLGPIAPAGNSPAVDTVEPVHTVSALQAGVPGTVGIVDTASTSVSAAASPSGEALDSVAAVELERLESFGPGNVMMDVDAADPLPEQQPEHDVKSSDEPFDWTSWVDADDLGIAGRRLLETAKRSAQSKTKTPVANKPSSSASKKAAPKAAKGKPKSKQNSLKAVLDRQRSSSVAASVPTSHDMETTPSSDTVATPSGMDREDSPASNEDAIYCICRKPYRDEPEDVTMVGCESCDNWFHPHCIGIPMDKVDMIDAYICKSCERSTKQRTKWKAMCKRTGCSKGLPPLATKFCSKACAFKHAQALIGGMTDKKKLKQLASELIPLPKPHASVKVIKHLHLDATDNFDLDSTLDLLRMHIEQTQAAIEVVRVRQAILQQAIERCETLAQPNGHDEAMELDEPRAKKSKSKSSGKPDDRVCGWDRRLMSADSEVRELQSAGDAAEGWQKTIAVALEVEAHTLGKRLAELQGECGVLERDQEAAAVADRARTNLENRLTSVRKRPP